MILGILCSLENGRRKDTPNQSVVGYDVGMCYFNIYFLYFRDYVQFIVEYHPPNALLLSHDNASHLPSPQPEEVI